MFDVPELDELPEDLRSRIKEVEEKSGFVPNIFLALARRPAEWRAFFALSNRLPRLTSTMPNEEFYLLGRLPRTPSALPAAGSIPRPSAYLRS